MQRGSWPTHPARDEPNLLLPFRLVRLDGFRVVHVPFGRKLVGEEYNRVPAHPVHTQALVSLLSPSHATFRNGSPLPVKRTELTGNTNVEELPVLAPVRELAPRLGLDDRVVQVEPGEFGRARRLGVFAIEARVVAKEVPGYRGRRRGLLEDWCYCWCGCGERELD